MTEQEKRALEDLNQDLPKYAISDGTRRFIAMDLAKKGYRKQEEVRKEMTQVLDRIEKYIYAVIDDKYLKEYIQNILLSERNHFSVR